VDAGDFDLHAEMVAAPDGKRWVVEARRPRTGAGVTMLVVRTLADAVVWRQVLPPEADPAVHVATVASTIRSGGWPGADDRPAPSSYWSPTVLVLLWMVVVTPLALLAWLRWLSGDASAAAPLVFTVVWAATGALVDLVHTRSTNG
jgi:hypothetical protein